MKFFDLGTNADGSKEEVAFDWDNSRAVFRTRHVAENINAVLDLNKEFSAYSDGYTPSRELQHVASIPMSVIGQWIEKYGVDPTARGNEALLSRLLNDPEWMYLRTGRGRVQFKE